MFILKRLMLEKGYIYIETERPMSNIRKSKFKKFLNKKKAVEIVIEIDERELEGISNIHELEAIYDRFIKKAFEKENVNE